MRKIAAPIDGKNVSIDWIDEIFDGCFCTMCGRQAVGFVLENPVYVYWENNQIFWKPVDGLSAKKTITEIKDRLKYLEDNQNDLFSEIYVVNDTYISQLFYWRVEDII
jgi:hypothetical protein